MKLKYIYYSIALLALSTSTISCDDYLDKMPDNRTELDTQEKITDLLVSAYPTTHYAAISEFTSDNTDEIAGTYTAYTKLQEEASLWQDITYEEEDSPYKLWNDSYHAIASANIAIKAIEDAGNPASLQSQKGEALLCRAFNHFILVNIFSKAYSPKTSTQDLGIPYMTGVETTVSPNYTRGTVAQDYELIAKDIEEGIPLIDDNLYSVPKYHFNKKAACAFAARFYLYYVQNDKSNYDKVIKYANEVLTSNPSNMLRDWESEGALTPNGGVRQNAFVSVDEKANLLLYSTASLWARYYGPYNLGQKYCHGTKIASTETCRSATLWGSYSKMYYKIPQYLGFAKVVMPKIAEYFEYSDPVNGIGYAHNMFPALLADEVILNRAEAYTMKGQYDMALADLNTWIHKFTSYTADVTAQSIAKVYGDYDETAKTGMKYYTPTDPTPKKELHPDFTVEKGEQENFIQAILHSRRILTLHEGLRWFDVKRYGLVIYRRTIETNGSITVTDTMDVNDPRRAIQLPQSVIKAGLETNPRIK
jgi:tetratricopeptide (TPR) repeat protein